MKDDKSLHFYYSIIFSWYLSRILWITLLFVQVNIERLTVFKKLWLNSIKAYLSLHSMYTEGLKEMISSPVADKNEISASGSLGIKWFAVFD